MAGPSAYGRLERASRASSVQAPCRARNADHAAARAEGTGARAERRSAKLGAARLNAAPATRSNVGWRIRRILPERGQPVRDHEQLAERVGEPMGRAAALESAAFALARP